MLSLTQDVVSKHSDVERGCCPDRVRSIDELANCRDGPKESGSLQAVRHLPRSSFGSRAREFSSFVGHSTVTSPIADATRRDDSSHARIARRSSYTRPNG